MKIRRLIVSAVLIAAVLPLGLSLAGCQDNVQTDQQLRYQDPYDASYYRYYYGDNEDAYSLPDRTEQPEYGIGY